MKITSNKKVVNGEHNETEFLLDGGLLYMFGLAWDRQKIKTLIETANMLHHHGHDIDEKREVTKRSGGVIYLSNLSDPSSFGTENDDE